MDGSNNVRSPVGAELLNWTSYRCETPQCVNEFSPEISADNIVVDDRVDHASCSRRSSIQLRGSHLLLTFFLDEILFDESVAQEG